MHRITVLVVAGLAALFALTILGGSWYTVDQTQRGVILRNGAIIGTAQPGLGFKVPWVDSIYKINMQTHTYNYGVSKEGASVMEAYSADQQPAFLRVSITLHVSPDKVTEMYARFGGDLDAAVARTIAPHAFAQTKVVFGRYTAARAISERGALNTAVAESIRQITAYDPVFVVEGVQIEDISFSKEYIKSVEARMMAEVEVQRQQQNLAQERIKAEITVTQAKATADSLLAQREAEAKGIRLRGEAEAQAITARAKALGDNPNLVLLTQAERWNGALPVTMIPGGSVPMLALGRQ